MTADPGLPLTTGEGNTVLDDVLVRVERAYLNEIAEQARHSAEEIERVGAWLAGVSFNEWFALSAECDRLREQLAEEKERRQRDFEHANYIAKCAEEAVAGLREQVNELSSQATELQSLLDAARQALEVYADPKHWAIRRNGTMYADCIWIGPGATDRVNPDGPGVARAALTPTRCPACYGDHGPGWKPEDGCLALPPQHRSVARAALGVEGPAAGDGQP